MVLLKVADWVLCQLLGNSLYRAARKIGKYGSFFRNPSLRSHQSSIYPSVSKCPTERRETKTLVCDFHGTLLRSTSFFPYFMLLAFEGGCIFRAFLLLLACPFLWVLDDELGLRVMIFISFCGLRLKDVESVGRAVLPKFFLENLNLQAYELLASTGSRVVFTSVPRVMVEGFLKEYLKVDNVVGTELQMVHGYFTGFLTSGLLVKHKAVKELFGESKPDIGLGGSSLHDQLFISLCKEAYVVNKEDRKSSANSVMPREKYPKPLVFHDGRLAFLPTPLATLCMFLWLPLGIFLAIFRLLVGILLPYKIALDVGAWSGVSVRCKGLFNSSEPGNKKGVLYVCSHRTLLDPVFLSTTIGKPVTAVTYSLSKVSELIAPIRTVRLTRDREQDGKAMQKLLSEGDLVVCPEGTTCREPYLLRFSSLFAELADEIIPVAMNTHVNMFYGTTASGFKCLDPIFFLMNPTPRYALHFLGKVPRELTCAGGRSSCEVANHIQRQMADALGFECTTLTRRDKYMMLAGNEGVVQSKREKFNNNKDNDSRKL
ncbi:glycerol-3-phosphate acyltransferase 1 [Tasmannia lanceolata]|uniref:glycerol-3-phosphate acyltransferase 1 n=1 Tax=Tasmannia lanceolata TaxID=3420 RepID=UPI004063BA0A